MGSGGLKIKKQDFALWPSNISNLLMLLFGVCFKLLNFIFKYTNINPF